MTDPVKTSSVKQSMVKVYGEIKKWDDTLTISKTNLSEYLGIGAA